MTPSALGVCEHSFDQHPFCHADCIARSCAEAQLVLSLGRVLTDVDDEADVSFLRSRGNIKQWKALSLKTQSAFCLHWLVRAGARTKFLDLIGKPLFSGKLGSQELPESQAGESFAKANM